jgi:hypothetical protein
MPTLPARKVWRVNDDGTTVVLPSISVEIWNVQTNMLHSTVVTDATGTILAQTVPGAVGDKFRLRVLNDGYGRCDSVTVLAE